MTVWELPADTSSEARPRFELPAPSATAVAFSTDGELIATGSTSGTVQLWGASHSRLLLSLGGHDGGIVSLRFVEGDTRLISRSFRNLRVWDVRQETRSPEEILKWVSCRVPYHIQDGELVEVVPDPRLCPPGASSSR